jgi:hypothetical protein
LNQLSAIERPLLEAVHEIGNNGFHGDCLSLVGRFRSEMH